MKKYLLVPISALCLVMVLGIQPARAQDKNTSKVHIIITENDKVTTDTTYELKEGQDPEMIKKMVGHLAGGEIHGSQMRKDVHISHGGNHEMVWIESDGDKNVWHAEHAMEGINLDSIKEAHKDAKVLVIKNKNGEVEVKEFNDDEDLEMIFHENMDGEHHKMMFIEEGEEGDLVHLKESHGTKKIMMISEDDLEKGEKKIIVTTISDDDDGEEQTIDVFVHEGDEMEWTEKGEGENVEVYVIKKGDKDVVVKKKIKVVVEEDDDSEVEVEVEVEQEKTEKKEK